MKYSLVTSGSESKNCLGCDRTDVPQESNINQHGTLHVL